MLGPWLWDELAVEDRESPQAPPNQPPRPRRRRLVYLDDYAPNKAAPGEGNQGGAGRAGKYGVADQRHFANTSVSAASGRGLLADEEEALSTQDSAVLNHAFRQHLSQMRNPAFDFDTWFFRTGRFRSN